MQHHLSICPYLPSKERLLSGFVSNFIATRVQNCVLAVESQVSPFSGDVEVDLCFSPFRIVALNDDYPLSASKPTT